MEFCEYMVKKVKTLKEVLICVLLYIAASVLSVIGYVFLSVMNLGGLALLLVAGVWFGAYKLVTRMNKEFEYICTEDNLDIDVIMNATSRRRLISFSMNDVEIIAPDNQDYKNITCGQFAKVVDATSGRKEANVYFAVVQKNERTLVKFEPSQVILSTLRQYAPSKVKA